MSSYTDHPRQTEFDVILGSIAKKNPFVLNGPISETDTDKIKKLKIREIYQDLVAMNLHVEWNEEEVQKKLIDLCHELQYIDLEKTNDLIDLFLGWHSYSAIFWYEKGKIMFQLFISRLSDDIGEIVNIFEKVIEMGEESPATKEYAYWAHIFIGNIFLYQILTGEEAMERALKYYNQGYRYAKNNNIEVDDQIIFDTVETMQQILMNQFPLLLVIYNDIGEMLFQYLFQLVEVMSQDQRFIPNFTALLSAVDDHINELFKSPVTSSYLVMENRLLVISTLYQRSTSKWVKVAMVFSYLQQSAFNVSIDNILLDKVSNFAQKINENNQFMDYLINFKGMRNDKIEEGIEGILNEVFSVDTSDIAMM